jgi:hypothetical protein
MFEELITVVGAYGLRAFEYQAVKNGKKTMSLLSLYQII